MNKLKRRIKKMAKTSAIQRNLKRIRMAKKFEKIEEKN